MGPKILKILWKPLDFYLLYLVNLKHMVKTLIFLEFRMSIKLKKFESLQLIPIPKIFQSFFAQFQSSKYVI